MIKEIIPLKIVFHEAKAFVAEVKIKIDGKDKYFLFDTGADTTVIETKFLRKFIHANLLRSEF